MCTQVMHAQDLASVEKLLELLTQTVAGRPTLESNVQAAWARTVSCLRQAHSWHEQQRETDDETEQLHHLTTEALRLLTSTGNDAHDEL
jgi:type II secretory pathway predicted ATPase ExeA